MDEQNKNPQPEKIRLMFDVMPEAAKNEQAQPQVPAEMPTLRRVDEIKKPPEVASQPPAENDLPEMPVESKPKFHLPTVKFNPKIILIIAGTLVVVIGGYFGYKYYVSLNEEPQQDNNLVAQRPGEQALPVEWVAKYFGGDSCDKSLCGMTADPDADGLKNSDEVKYNSNPVFADSDFDGLADSDELQVYNTDPVVADTDGDRFEDGAEVRNGYSPTVNSQDPIAVVEKQVVSDNSEKFGLHEPTKTFLRLIFYKPIFPSTASTSQISLSLPKDWSFRASGGLIIFQSPDASASLQLILNETNPADAVLFENIWRTATNVIDGKSIKLGQQKFGNLQVNVHEYQVYKQGTQEPQDHVLRVMFLKADRLYDVVFLDREQNWEASRVLAQTVIQSIR